MSRPRPLREEDVAQHLHPGASFQVTMKIMDPAKEAARRRFLSRVRDHRRRVARMREIAVKVGLSPALWPNEQPAKGGPDIWAGRRLGIPGDRGTGRTTRMLLSAAVDVLDGYPVVICAHSADYARALCLELGSWLHRTGEMPLFVGQMVKWRSLADKEAMSFQGYRKDTRFYCDHYATRRPDLRMIGREWSEAPIAP